MKIGIDITPIKADKAGIGYLTSSLVKALGEIDNFNEYSLFSNEEIDSSYLPTKKNFTFRIISSNKPNAKWMIKTIECLNNENFDYFISTSNFLWSILFPRTIQIINDIGPVIYPQFFGLKSAINYSIQLRLALSNSIKILTISKTVAEELTKLNSSHLSKILPKLFDLALNIFAIPSKSKIIKALLMSKSKRNTKIDYLPLGVHNWVLEKKSKDYYSRIKEKYKIPEKYFVSISTLEPRKNHINMLKGFAKFVEEEAISNNSDYKLVIVGKNGWFYNEIYKTVQTLNISDKVIFTGYVPEEDLAGLIDLSQGSLILSFYEGFGLPILECLTRGKCALISDIKVFREITKGSQNVSFATPSNTDSIALGLKALKKQEFVSEDIGLLEYSWTNCARKLLDALSL